MFKLFRYFSVTTAVVVVVASVLAAYIYRQHKIAEIIEFSEKENITLAQSFANTLWPRFGIYLRSAGSMDKNSLRDRPLTQELHDALKDLTARLPVLKVKIYALNGVTVYSSDSSQIGEVTSDSPGFMYAAQNGRPKSKRTHLDTFRGPSGVIHDRDIVESYIPVQGASGHQEGVFELYSDVTPMVASVEDSTVKLIGVILAISTLIYATVFLIVRHADGILKRQYVELDRENAERRQAEDAHRRAEERLRGAVESMRAGFALFDADDRLVMANDDYFKLYPNAREALEKGWRYEELLRVNIRQGVIMDAIGREEEFYQERMKQHLNPSGEMIRRFTDGAWYIIKEVRTPEGGIAMSFIDVSELKEAEEKVRKLAKFPEENPDPVMRFDEDGRLAYANDASMALLDSAGIRVGDRAPEGLRWVLAEAFEDRAPREVERTFGDQSFSLLVSPVASVGGIEGHLNVYGRNITQRKRAEARLRESENRFRDIVESSSDWIWEMDAELRFSYFSDRFTEATGVPKEQVLGRTRQEVMTGGWDEAEWQEHLADLEARRTFRDFRYRFLLDDGSVRQFSVSGKPVFDEIGRFRGYRGTCSDITAQVEAEERARSAQERLAIAVEGLSEHFVLFDADDRIVLSNQAWRDLNRPIAEWCKPGIRFEDHLRAAIKAQLIPDSVGREEEWLAERMERHRNPGEPFEVERQDGFWLLINEQRLVDGGTVLVISDISESKRAEARLRESEARFRTILDNSPAKIHVKDLDGRYLLINRLSEELFGVTDAEARGKTTAEIFPKEIADAFMGHDQAVIETGKTIEEEEEWVRGDGVHTFLTVKFPIPDANGNITAVGAIGTDITERKRSQAQIEKIALHDTLTGLPNRFLFHQRLGDAMVQAKRNDGKLALMFLDLDDFKGVNDTLGHDAGDELLKEVAGRLQAQLRESDVLGRHENTLARLGGDEFTIILTNLADPIDSVTVAERILAKFRSPFTIARAEIHCGVSIGIAVYPTHGTEPEELLKTADMALYRAKAEGRNTYCFYSEELEAQVLVRKTIESDLRKAVDAGQLSLVYQPQISVMSGRTVGFEALLRWNHPERGPIAPEVFIPVAEATGLILPIGKWVIERACAQNKAWQDAGLPRVPVAVNVSPIQFQQENVLATVATAIEDSGLDPASLCVEITESLVMRDDFVSSGVLHGLRRLGVKIALDDFGTGYSSLSYLMRLPVDKIKLDGSFLHDIEYDAGGAAIVKAIVSLGHSLGMQVNMEGAETLDQVAVLSSSGVDEIQGFYFSEALETDAVPQFLTTDTQFSCGPATPPARRAS